MPQLTIRYQTEFATWPHEAVGIDDCLIDVKHYLFGTLSAAPSAAVLINHDIQLASKDKTDPDVYTTPTLDLKDGSPFWLYTFLWYGTNGIYLYTSGGETFSLNHNPAGILGGIRNSGDNEDALHRFGTNSPAWIIKGDQGQA